MAALCAMLLGLVCTNLILKPLVMRPRPWLDVAGLIPLINEADPNSFPSGHTCAAFAAAMIFWRALPSQWAGGAVSAGGHGRLYGPVPAVCGGPLSQRRAGRGAGRFPVRLDGVVFLADVSAEAFDVSKSGPMGTSAPTQNKGHSQHQYI